MKVLSPFVSLGLEIGILIHSYEFVVILILPKDRRIFHFFLHHVELFPCGNCQMLLLTDAVKTIFTVIPISFDSAGPRNPSIEAYFLRRCQVDRYVYRQRVFQQHFEAYALLRFKL